MPREIMNFLSFPKGPFADDVLEIARATNEALGLVLDPVSTAKAMMGFIDLVRTGFFEKTDRIVFLHTGGTPALFPNREKIVGFLAGKS